jgi:transposase
MLEVIPMKKRSYRSVNVKKVDWERLAEEVRGERVVLGVDVAKERFAGSVMLARREEEKLIISWQNPKESAALVNLVAGLPAAKLEVAMEPSGTYGDPLRWLFSKRQVEVFRVSPKRSHDAAEVYDGVPSWHDSKSAGLIAKLHLHGASEPWPPRSEGERELTAAVRTMEMYDKQEHSNLNRVEAQLARHWPELTRHLELTSATLLELVKELGSPAAVAEEEGEARELMRRVGGHFLRDDKIEAVLEDAAGSIGVPMVEGERRALQKLAAEVLRCRAEGRKAKREVEALAAGNESASRMGAVVGKATAAVLVAGIGDPQGYHSAGAMEKAVGLNLKERSSGLHKGQLKITKRGPGDCRFYLYLAALRLIMNDPVVARWYGRKVARDGGRYKNKAVVAVMRKLVKGLWHVARGAELDSTLLFDARRLGFGRPAERERVTTCFPPEIPDARRDTRVGGCLAGELLDDILQQAGLRR